MGTGKIPKSVQIKNFNIGIHYFFVKDAALRNKCKDWLARNQYNVSKQGAHIQLSLLVKYKTDIILMNNLSKKELMLSP